MKLFTATIALIARSVVLRTEPGENIIALDDHDHHRENEGATKKVLASVEASGAISEISQASPAASKRVEDGSESGGWCLDIDGQDSDNSYISSDIDKQDCWRQCAKKPTATACEWIDRGCTYHTGHIRGGNNDRRYSCFVLGDIAPCVEHNVDYRGNDIFKRYEVPKVEDVGVCRKKCIANDKCEYFTFNQETTKCYLKTAATGWKRSEDDGGVSGTKHCSHKPGCFSKDTDYYGYDLGRGVDLATSIPEECQKRCQERVDCHYFTFVPGTKHCMSKTSNETSKTYHGAISGPKYCAEKCSKGGEDGAGYACGAHASRNDDAECPKNGNCFDTCCKCADGYEHKGGKKCVHIDECTEEQPCPDNKKCEKIDGSYKCVAIEKEVVEPKTSKTHQTNQTTDEVEEPEGGEKVKAKNEAKEEEEEGKKEEKAEAKKEEEEEGSYIPYIIGGSVAGVLLLGCGGYFFMRSQADTE